MPKVMLDEGEHTVTARVPWTARPTSLPVPAAVRTIALTLDGSAVPFPRLDSD